jgi:hypothetical protein
MARGLLGYARIDVYLDPLANRVDVDYRASEHHLGLRSGRKLEINQHNDYFYPLHLQSLPEHAIHSIFTNLEQITDCWPAGGQWISPYQIVSA